MKGSISAVLFACFVCCSSLSLAQAVNSPVGTWEVTVGGGNHGIAFIEFDADFTLKGYGMTLESFGMFTLSGTWAVDTKGNLAAIYTEQIDGQSLSGSITGRATTGKKLRAKTVAPNGTLTLRGIPVTTTPDISGHWISYGTQNKVKSAPQFVMFSPSNVYGGVFDVSGSGTGADGSFTAAGDLIITSKGQVVAFTGSHFSAGGSGFASIVGRFNLVKQTGSGKGITDDGQLTWKLTR